jgi:hypothetical protein
VATFQAMWPRSVINFETVQNPGVNNLPLPLASGRPVHFDHPIPSGQYHFVLVRPQLLDGLPAVSRLYNVSVLHVHLIEVDHVRLQAAKKSLARALVHFEAPRGMVGWPPISSVLAAPMPYKHNADRRHHIPKMSFKVQNWPEYEAGLRRRGSLTLWIEDVALDHWQSCGPGGQARYTDAAIQTSLMVRTAFKLPLRQIEGLMASILTLMDLTISGV